MTEFDRMPAAIATFFFLILAATLRLFASVQAWRWFAVPLGAPALDWKWILALQTLWTILFREPKRHVYFEQTDEERMINLRAAVGSLVFVGIAYAFAALIHVFLGSTP